MSPKSSKAAAAAAAATASHPEGKPRYWYRDNFFLTTDKAYLEPQAVNAVFESDLMWWNDPLPEDQMRKMLANCMTVSVYHVPESEKQMQTNGPPKRPYGSDIKLVGLARVITDYVTFAYLTDVFIVEEFQRRGLASWMMRGLKEVVDEWPHLRGLVLMTHDKAAAKMYQRELGALDWDQGPSAGLVLLEMPGGGVKDVPEDHK
ncbi:putative GNAT family N-acetyltransferase [Trichoderma reesei RUT C-30]|uniref:Putative GNAT family N-acetyltransferase n=1 Tax=Hypocrea jecorina (strain ATCC 56765 / BCRC 32924 / NRRL 11460 / Rut C-30) TaxID=1344414 RepID=A0A024S4W0_HYPJR|nr:putative GNAT family N-acetyltransferase [Trichoderma reesei RUT C-30]